MSCVRAHMYAMPDFILDSYGEVFGEAVKRRCEKEGVAPIEIRIISIVCICGEDTDVNVMTYEANGRRTAAKFELIGGFSENCAQLEELWAVLSQEVVQAYKEYKSGSN